MNLELLKTYRLNPIDHDYSAKDTMLYALGLGYGSDPLDEAEIPFVFEDGLLAVPSMCNTIAHPGFWISRPELGINWVKVLHGEQSFTIHRPLTGEGRLRGTYRISAIEDKGVDRGAVMYLEKRLTDRDSGDLVCTVMQSIFMRGDGGQGGFGDVPAAPGPMPDRLPDLVVELPTSPRAALIYRLSGDYNPIHASPARARQAGFDRPILHGLCTMGVATRALVRGVCNQDPSLLADMYVRFSSPVYPGETIRTEIFREGSELRFRCLAVERGVIVLDRGLARLNG